jgi:hypothetical protein
MGIQKILLLFVTVALFWTSGCIVSTPYDKQYRKPKPYAFFKRPAPVRPNVNYRFGWMSPFGNSSIREKWPKYHGMRKYRKHYWPHWYLPPNFHFRNTYR